MDGKVIIEQENMNSNFFELEYIYITGSMYLKGPSYRLNLRRTVQKKAKKFDVVDRELYYYARRKERYVMVYIK